MAYTTIDDPSAHFQTVLYTGNGSDGYSITNSGNSDLQPDLLWFKNRNDTQIHQVFDTTRGIASSLQTNDNDAQNTDSPNDRLTAINSDGFTLGDDGNPNTNTNTYVCWQWKVNGGTTSSNTAGDITTTIQNNATAGISMFRYTGPNTGNDSANNSGNFWSLGHGLGVKPEMVILKGLDGAHGWYVWHKGYDGTSVSNKYLLLNYIADNPGVTTASNNILWGNTEFSSTLIEIGGWDVVNRNAQTYMVYCFASIQGYSKIGTYVGNGSTDGAFVYTGFQPAWIMTKSDNVSTDDSWVIYDNQMNPNNDGAATNQFAEGAYADNANDYGFDILSNGFKIRATTENLNGSTKNYYYIAFAHHPFVTSGGVPCTAR
jgi:hypothetical protein